jgi:hypothetical protein
VLVEQGGNYRIELTGGIAVCAIWRRPDVSREEGSRFAIAKAEAFDRLLAQPRIVVTAIALDLREAPRMWGPTTQDRLEHMVSAFERAQRRIAAIVSDEPIQALQMRRIVRACAPTYGRLFDSLERGVAWLRETRRPQRRAG